MSEDEMTGICYAVVVARLMVVLRPDHMYDC